MEVRHDTRHALGDPHWGLVFDPADLDQLLVQLSDSADFRKIELFLSHRPALLTLILRSANSAKSGRSDSLTTARHALTFLGLEHVRTLLIQAKKRVTHRDATTLPND